MKILIALGLIMFLFLAVGVSAVIYFSDNNNFTLNDITVNQEQTDTTNQIQINEERNTFCFLNISEDNSIISEDEFGDLPEPDLSKEIVEVTEIPEFAPYDFPEEDTQMELRSKIW